MQVFGITTLALTYNCAFTRINPKPHLKIFGENTSNKSHFIVKQKCKTVHKPSSNANLNKNQNQL
ncbi:hypothetical protein CWC17_14640 [Pseudoalteromonas sp. S3785]|nr:hypothetical protein CWC17_14640 [Pseudoalteromonas sp. S3785]